MTPSSLSTPDLMEALGNILSEPGEMTPSQRIEFQAISAELDRRDEQIKPNTDENPTECPTRTVRGWLGGSREPSGRSVAQPPVSDGFAGLGATR
jgi:hypothetical protein